jgi:hypothetical protein
MSTALANRRAAGGGVRSSEPIARAQRGERGTRPALFDPVGGEPTLDEVLASAWEGLTAHRTVACPVCGGSMEPAGAQPHEARGTSAVGRCRSCDSTLS